MAGVGGAPDPDLERLRRDRGDPRAVHLLAGEEPAHRVETRFEARRPPAQRHAHGRELVGPAADRGLHDEAAAGDRRQGADLLGEQHRRPERQQEQRAGGPVTPLREQAADNRDVLVVDARRGRVVVADEQRGETGAVRRPRPLDHPARAGARLGGVRRSAVTLRFSLRTFHSIARLSRNSQDPMTMIVSRTPPCGRERRRFRRRPPAEGTSGARLRGRRPSDADRARSGGEHPHVGPGHEREHAAHDALRRSSGRSARDSRSPCCARPEAPRSSAAGSPGRTATTRRRSESADRPRHSPRDGRATTTRAPSPDTRRAPRTRRPRACPGSRPPTTRTRRPWPHRRGARRSTAPRSCPSSGR